MGGIIGIDMAFGIVSGRRWLVLAWHILVALLMMQVCRIVFVRYNAEFFPPIEGSTFWELLVGSFILDVLMVAYCFICYIVVMTVGAYLPPRVETKKGMRVVRHLAYFVPFVLLLFMQISDTGYYPFVLQRANSHVFWEFQGKNIMELYGDFIIDFWPLTLTFFVLLLVGVLLYRLFRFEPDLRRDTSLKQRLPGAIVGTIVVSYLAMTAMRSTFQWDGAPRGLASVYPYVEDDRHMPIVYNTPFSLFYVKGGRSYHTFFSKEELSSYFTPYYQASPLCEGDSLFGSMAGRNVMVIILESMAKEYIGVLNSDQPGYPSYTPFLDSLIPQSLYAKYGFASGKRSVESLPAIVASLPTFGGTFNDRDWTMDNYRHFKGVDSGLTTALGSQHYFTKFYHGDVRGGMGFFDFLASLGVEEQYTREEFALQYSDDPIHATGAWGVDDMPFMDAMAKDLRGLSTPFCAIFFSLSNHYPYIVPKNYTKQLRKGTLPIHQTAQYCDDALAHFFAEVRESEWYQNTLFVITCDHTNESDQPTYDNIAGKAAAPILFYDPQGKLKGMIDDRVLQHCDIAPTLLYLMGIEEPIMSYGGNIFDDQRDHYALNYYQDKYILLHHDLTVTINSRGEVEVEPPTRYLQCACPEPTLPDMETQEHFATLLKAITQDHCQRVRNHSFTFGNVQKR